MITSPGTSSSALISRTWRSRFTAARVTSICLSAWLARSARDSWMAPMTALMTRTPQMNAASFTSPRASETAAAAPRT